MVRFFLASFLLFPVSGCIESPVPSDELIDDKRSEAAGIAAVKRQAKIKNEIESLDDHLWAGEYEFGDGLGVNVSLFISPTQGFDYEWHGCLGLYDRNHGSVSFANNVVSLSCKYPNKEKSNIGIAEKLIPVAWGKRKYLIPEDDVVGFCNEINCGNEPRIGFYGNFLMRRDDGKKKVTGLPDLPKEYGDYVLSEPLVANLTRIGESKLRPSVSDWNFKDTAIFLDVGEKDGARVGMKLYLIEHDKRFETIEIKKVENDSCECLLWGFEEDWIAPEVGWKFSTTYKQRTVSPVEEDLRE